MYFPRFIAKSGRFILTNAKVTNSLNTNVDQIKEKLISLRKQRVEFYKALLEEDLQRRRDYDEKIEKELKFLS